MHLVDTTERTFTTAQWQRLEAYRAAVAAGFYTDWDGTTQHTDTRLLEWLRAADERQQRAAFPFTRAERRHLEQCRAAFRSGRYAEDGPPAAPSATSDGSVR